MAYKRTETYDGVTKMNKTLYDNLQDGIDESIGTICNIVGADKYNENKIYKNGDKCIINNKIYSKTGDMADDTVLPHPFDISEWEEISIMTDIMIQMSAMQSSIEAIINGLEEKFGDGGLYMKNWKIIKNESPSGLGINTIKFIAPANDFIVVYHNDGPYVKVGNETAPEIVGAEYEQILYNRYWTNVYGGMQIGLYSLHCNKGDEITMNISKYGSESYDRFLSLVLIY